MVMKYPVMSRCPACQSEELRFFGLGTRKVEEYLNMQFPSARIMRMDVDTTSKKRFTSRIDCGI